MRLFVYLMGALLCLETAFGQISLPGLRRGAVRATGQASLSVSPDLARVTVSVETRAATANDAANQNATQTNALLTILRQFLGANADIKTVGYSLSPVYVYPKEGAPTITGYTAVNSLQVSLSDLSQVGRLIDLAVQGGASRIQGIQFTLKDPQPVQTRALRQAAEQAKIQAEAIAAGLGVRTGGVLWAEESSGVQPVSLDVVRAAAPTTTPVEPGLVVVTANVTVELEIR